MDRLEIRKEIDALDDQLTGLFVRRMELCGQMADYKIANNLPLLDRGRELPGVPVIGRPRKNAA